MGDKNPNKLKKKKKEAPKVTSQTTVEPETTITKKPKNKKK